MHSRPETTIKCSICGEIIIGITNDEYFIHYDGNKTIYYHCRPCHINREHADAKRRYECMVSDLNETSDENKELKESSNEKFEEYKELDEKLKECEHVCVTTTRNFQHEIAQLKSQRNKRHELFKKREEEIAQLNADLEFAKKIGDKYLVRINKGRKRWAALKDLLKNWGMETASIPMILEEMKGFEHD